MRAALATLAGLALFTCALPAIAPDTLDPIRSVPPEIAGRFREARGFQQSASGRYYVFDRRAHEMWGIDPELAGPFRIVEIGAEPGRIIDPTSFAVAPDGTFVVADAPRGMARIQAFTSAGFRTAGFFISGGARPRITIEGLVLSGIGSMQFTGTSVLLSQPEHGSLVSEYLLSGAPGRSIGQLRTTGQEADRDVHLALNSGIPLLGADGSIVYVFQAGLPVFRKYAADGTLVFERQIQGREIDDIVPRLPSTWPRNPLDGELPLVRPTIRAAALDRLGRLWAAFEGGFTYVFDADGDKIRVVRFRGVGPVSPTTLFFGRDNHLLVTPGLHEYDVDARP
ncbi:MAG: hypothetical protein AB7H96_08980 [Vicinamibacterales bacterium]